MELTEKEKKILSSFQTRKEYERKELLINILKVIAYGGFLAAVFVAPNMGILFKYWKAYKKHEQQRIKRKISYLVNKGYIKFDAKKKKYFLTNKGLLYLRKHEIKALRPKNKRWDKKWRLLFFDIPESKRAARVMLRDKIVEWGFVGIQKSVFLSKIDCKQEIKKLKKYFDLSNEIILIEIDDKEIDAELKRYTKQTKIYTKTYNPIL